jgi:hypothetical protein
MLADYALQGVQACPGKALNESFVDVRQAGVGQMVAQVVQVRLNALGAYQLARGLRVSEGFIPCGDP